MGLSSNGSPRRDQIRPGLAIFRFACPPVPAFLGGVNDSPSEHDHSIVHSFDVARTALCRAGSCHSPPTKIHLRPYSSPVNTRPLVSYRSVRSEDRHVRIGGDNTHADNVKARIRSRRQYETPRVSCKSRSVIAEQRQTRRSGDNLHHRKRNIKSDPDMHVHASARYPALVSSRFRGNTHLPCNCPTPTVNEVSTIILAHDVEAAHKIWPNLRKEDKKAILIERIEKLEVAKDHLTTVGSQPRKPKHQESIPNPQSVQSM
ncbi:hypothetical protein F4861DRAFT_321430 [Xylaria intraflava]|nr:hypothetical protein F4861DRAFT_321430 [Xylaria intraflava]